VKTCFFCGPFRTQLIKRRRLTILLPLMLIAAAGRQWFENTRLRNQIACQAHSSRPTGKALSFGLSPFGQSADSRRFTSIA
jgi:hypothetical protein